MFDLDLTHLPPAPGVYEFKDENGKILYIGKAKNLQKRIAQYFAKNSLRKQEMLAKAHKVDVFVVENEGEALYLENNLIKQYKPFYNTLLKGGNGYTYIKITPEACPQVLTTRMKKDDGATYLGPKRNSQELKKLIQYLRQLLKFRTCPRSQFRQGKLCSDFYFGLCKGRCTNKKDDETTSEASPDRKQLFISFFKGNTAPVEKELKRQIHLAVQQEHFEWAAKLRDIYVHIAQMVEKQHVELEKPITGAVVEIRDIGAWHVFVLLRFYEGRLIDVVRDKVSMDDGDQDWMLANLEAELDVKFEETSTQREQFRWLAARDSAKCVPTLSDKKGITTLLEHFFDSYVVVSSFEGENLNNELLKTLQERYGLKHFPYWMECVDISHLGGSWISGGLSCMKGGLLEKKGYRRYKILKGKDDYASLSEVIERRFTSQTLTNGPDIFILDGGKGQLGVVKEWLEAQGNKAAALHTTFISLGKGEARKKSRIGSSSKRGTGDIVGEKVYRFDQYGEIIEIPLVYDQADRLLLKLRDEAHRFSNAYRKVQMKREFTDS